MLRHGPIVAEAVDVRDDAPGAVGAGMQEVLAAGAGFAGLVAVLAVTLRGARPRAGPARRWGDLRAYSDPGDAPGFIAGLLGALSVASAVSGLTSLPNIGASDGAVVGLIAAVLVSAGALGRTVFRVLFGGIGAVTAVLGLLAFIGGSSCASGSAAVRVAAAVLLVVCAGLGAILPFGRQRRAVPRGLTWFAAVELLVFLASPLGLSTFPVTSGPLPTVTLVVAAAAGFASSFAPTVVLGLAALGIAVSTAAAGAVGLTCGGVDPGALAVVLGFSVVFLLVRGGLRLLGLR